MESDHLIFLQIPIAEKEREKLFYWNKKKLKHKLENFIAIIQIMFSIIFVNIHIIIVNLY